MTAILPVNYGMLDEMHRLVATSLAGNISDPERARLDELVGRDAETCDLYLDVIFESGILLTWAIHGGLKGEGTGEEIVDQQVSDGYRETPSPRADSPAPTFPAILPALPDLPTPTSLSPSLGYSAWTISYLSSAVITGLLILGFWLMPASRPEQVAKSVPPSVPVIAVPIAEPKAYVGRITATVDCQIGDSRVSLGQKLDLASGLMEITYDTGAKVILQGPVTYEVESNGGYLSVGKLTGKLEKNEQLRTKNEEVLSSSSSLLVPNSYFVIRTPTATVTDLGTEFGVEVSSQGVTETQVFRGAIELRVSGASDRAYSTILRPEHGTTRVEVGKDNVPVVRRTVAKSDIFVRRLPTFKRIPLVLFNTGVNIPEGRPDPHWQIVAFDHEPKFQKQAAIVAPVVYKWVPNFFDKCQWISTAADNSKTRNGTYTFRTTFTIPPEMRPDTVRLAGLFGVDNYVRAIRLNGCGISVPEHSPYEDFDQMFRFSIVRGFVSGTNVLEFDVKNGSPIESEDASGWMGLRVELEGTGVGSAEQSKRVM